MTSAYAMTSFLSQATGSLIKEHEGKGIVPAPSLLLVSHPGVAKLFLVGLFGISVAFFFVSRSRMKEEADQLAVQGAVFGLVWWLGFAYAAGVIMAAVVAYVALNPR